jgi:CheY-like chemotaxis protein
VRELVGRHGGTVRAESVGSGQGSEFTITLPLAAAPADAGEGPAAQPVAGEGLSVMIVEDNEDAGASLAELLALGGHETNVATCGRDGVEAAIVFCDIGLPGLDGYEVARRLRADSRESPILVAVTGYARPEDQRKVVAAGFDHHLTKPMDFAQLDALLARLVGGAG